MKRIYTLLSLILLLGIGLSAQDSIYLYKNNHIFSKYATVDIDSIAFKRTESLVQTSNYPVGHIDFRHQVSEGGLTSALETLDQSQILSRITSAQFSMRGGKGGNPPISHAYQWQYSLQVDNYSGYFCLPQNFAGRISSTYDDSKAFNGSVMSGYELVRNYIAPVLNHPQIDSIPELKAMTLLLFNMAAHETADVYGPIPYADYKVNKQEHPYVYNSLDTIYYTIVQDIDTIVACFKNYANRPEWYKNIVDPLFEQYDVISPNSENRISNWIRFANSLKLRLALQSSKVNPLAKKWAESAVVAGVIETVDQQFALIPAEIGFVHPLFEIANSWNDTRLNASFETILKQYNHPLLGFVFKKNEYPIVNKDNSSEILPENSRIVGLRAGIPMLSGQVIEDNFRVAYSSISGSIENMTIFLMKLSEVNFLRAEGALRGWNMGGSAESFYNAGIQNAFAATNIQKMDDDTDWEPLSFDETIYTPFVREYMNITSAPNIQYVDPYSSEYNMNSLVKVGVKWNSSDSNETKLEKIITQKHIAGFPFSITAWNDLRRTGYPHLFPVVMDEGDQSITPGDIIRRIPYPGIEDDEIRADIENTAIKGLGGMGNKQGTRLWWDAGTNF